MDRTYIYVTPLRHLANILECKGADPSAKGIKTQQTSSSLQVEAIGHIEW